MLHTISNQAIDIEMINADDAVLFWQNGVALSLKNNHTLSMILSKTSHCYVLNNDIIARGLSHLIDKNVKLIDIEEVVKLTETYFPQIKW